VICNFDSAGWAYLCAGGSLPRLPRTTDARLLAVIPRLQPWPEASSPDRWVMRGPGEYLVYLGSDADPALDFSREGGPFVVKRIDLTTGQITTTPKATPGVKDTRLPKPPDAIGAFWLTKEQI